MSEPIREQLAKVVTSQTREFHREPNFGHSASGSANECSECERQRGVFLASLSPVGETEAAKLPLDPEPYVLGNGQRFAKRDIGEMDYIPDFAPEPKYSQTEEDY